MITIFAYFIGGSLDLTKRSVDNSHPPYIRIPRMVPMPVMSMKQPIPEIVDVQTDDYRLLGKHRVGRDEFLVFGLVDAA